MPPKISFIIPVYNTEQYLSECLDSILHQSLQDIELIVVNDHSPGNCVEIVERYMYHDHRIKLLNLPSNHGTFSARNLGILEATGEYIQFIDSDDTLGSLCACKRLYSYMINHDVDMCFFNYCNDGITVSRVKGLYFWNTVSISNYQALSLVLNTADDREFLSHSLCRIIVQRQSIQQSIQKLKNMPHIVQTEDLVHMIYFLQETNNILIVPDRIYQYRQGVGISHAQGTKKTIKRFLDVIYVFRELEKLINKELPAYRGYFLRKMNIEVLYYYSLIIGIPKVVSLIRKISAVNLQEYIRIYCLLQNIDDEIPMGQYNCSQAPGIKRSIIYLFYSVIKKGYKIFEHIYHRIRRWQ